MAEHVRVEVVELSSGGVTLDGDSEQVRPAGVEAEAVRLTALMKWLSEVTVIVEVPDSPLNIWLGLTGPAETVKSGVTGVVKPNVMSAVV